VLFFKDRQKKVLKQQLIEVQKELKKQNSIKKEIEVISSVKHIFTTKINEIPIANASLSHYEVALYFYGGMGNIYQIEQWLGTLNALNQQKEVVFIVRNKDVYAWIKENTNFIVIYCRTIESLTKVYEENNFKCVLYVNNGFKNFQSLMVGDALHVHINHGESDKTSTITNQSKAYDYVFIVGDAAYDKYNLNLIKKDMSKYIKVGRPQLEHIEEIPSFNEEKLKVDTYPKGGTTNINAGTKESVVARKKVILYAPTWEGTHESMNFSSLGDYGMQLVQQLLNHPDYYLVYKPHPNTGSRDESIKNINNAITKLLQSHEGGEAITGGDINSLYKHVDLAIFDNSAVAIDYLIADKPMIMTDMFHRIKDRQSKPTITKAARMLSPTDVYNIPLIIKEELENDTLKQQRNKIKRYFLGDFNYEKKESTIKFISTIEEIIRERDKLVDELKKANEAVSPIV